MALAATDEYSRPTPVTTATTNVFMEAWVYPTTTSGLQLVAFNGDGAGDGNGYGFLEYGSLWSFYEPGHSYNYNLKTPGFCSDRPVGSPKLLLDSNGYLTGYINGTPVVTNSLTANTPSGGFFIGGTSFDYGFTGYVDDVELFTPEPASLQDCWRSAG